MTLPAARLIRFDQNPLKSDASDYEVIVTRIRDLQQEDEDRPTDYATEFTLSLLRAARVRMPAPFPLAWVMGDEGGIRLEWTNKGKSVRLVIPAASGGQMYLYHEFGDDYGVDESVTENALARRLSEMSA